MVFLFYGKATYNTELQVRHQKLLTIFVLISVANMCRKKVISKYFLKNLHSGDFPE